MTPKETQRLETRLLELLYDELPTAEVEAARQEIADHPELEARLRQWERVRAAAASLPEIELDAEVRYNVLRAARQAADKPAKVSFWSFFGGLTPALSGVAVLMLAVVGVFTMTRGLEDSAPEVGQAPTKAAPPESPAPATAVAPKDLRPAADPAPPPEQRARPARGPGAEAQTATVRAGEDDGLLEASKPTLDDKARAPVATRRQPKAKPKPKAKRRRRSRKKARLADPFGYDGRAGKGGGAKTEGAKRDEWARESARAKAQAQMPAPEPEPVDEPQATPALRQVVEEKQAEGVQFAPPPPAPSAADNAAGSTSGLGDADDEASLDVLGGASGRSSAAAPNRAVVAPAPPRVDDDRGAAEQRQAPPASLRTARAARRAGDHRAAVRSYEDFLRGNQGHSEFTAALFETAQSYEELGDLPRATQLYRLVARSGGRLAGMAAKRLDRMTALRRKAKKRKRPAKPAAAADERLEAEEPASKAAPALE